MKIKCKILVSLLLIGIVFIFGCTEESNPPPSGPIGGGCGVTVPTENIDYLIIGEVLEVVEKQPLL